MTGLIIKDIASVKKSLLFTIIIAIGIGGYGLYKDVILMIPLLCAIIPMLLNAISFGYDAKANFEQFAFSMPIKKSGYVLSKFFFPLLFGLLGSISLFIFLTIKGQNPIETIVFISALTLLVSLLISGIQLPFILKFGEEKGRLIMVISYFFIFGLSLLFSEKTDLIEELIELISKYSLKILFGLVIVGFLLIGITIMSSIIILENKEY